MLACGYVLSGFAGGIWQFALAQGLHRTRQFGSVRAADERHLALVLAPPRHRGRAGRPAAIISPARYGRRWCSISSPATAGAPTQIGDRPVLRGHDAAADPCAAAAGAARIVRRRAAAAAGARRHAGRVAERADGAAVHRRRRLLRRHGDAAGAHRRLLRRPRLRPCARRRDAGRDDGLRHRQPHRARVSSPTASAACRRCCSARCCRARAVPLSVVRRA